MFFAGAARRAPFAVYTGNLQRILSPPASERAPYIYTYIIRIMRICQSDPQRRSGTAAKSPILEEARDGPRARRHGQAGDHSLQRCAAALDPAARAPNRAGRRLAALEPAQLL